MLKYLYLLGVVFSFFTFMAGWSHFMENQVFDYFNVGLMALTPFISFSLTLLFLHVKAKKEEMEDLEQNL